MDTNKDGTVTWEEFMDYMTEGRSAVDEGVRAAEKETPHKDQHSTTREGEKQDLLDHLGATFPRETAPVAAERNVAVVSSPAHDAEQKYDCYS